MSQPSTNAPADNQPVPTLQRHVGVFGAMMMGLGSIVGTGVFVSIAIAADVTGPSVVLAIALAAVVATCNGISSAQLAANHPVSGGTYEYGYRWLSPALGFTAGWMFLCAKSASAATAALGFASYTLHALGADSGRWQVSLAFAAIAALTLLILTGIKRSNWANIVIVSVTLLALAAFVVCGLPLALERGSENLSPFFSPADGSPWTAFFHASALMFVAYTGYGRIATLAEEVDNPRRTIPMAIIATLLISMTLYGSVGLVGVAAVGTEGFATEGDQAAPLEIVASQFPWPAISKVVAVGAVTAMLGVLLNLILGLSRVVLAMARRSDIPTVFAGVSQWAAVPHWATLLVGVGIAGLAAIGDVKTTWSFSAFTVLIYYSLTNLAALRLSPAERLYPRGISWLGLASCLFLAWWVEPTIWLTGVGLILLGLIWHAIARKLARPSA